jgi:hypothetical protein
LPFADPGVRSKSILHHGAGDHALYQDRERKQIDVADQRSLFPSLYAFNGDAASIACWPNYAKANIKEARIYGKPVWGFLWMKYHVSRKWIPASFWRTQLNTTYTAADGLVIWSMANGSSSWSWSAPWWLQTKDFLADQRLVP